MKFRDFIEGRWINDLLPAYKLSTGLQYRYFMDRYSLPYFGEWKLEDIRSEEVQRFLRLFPKLAPKTVRNMAAALSSSLGTAVRWGYLETNPVRGVVMPPKRSVRERRALTTEEVKALLGKPSGTMSYGGDPHPPYWDADRRGAGAALGQDRLAEADDHR